MWHTAAYGGSIALTSTNQPVNAIADGILKVGSANGFVLQEDMMLLGAYAGGVGLSNPRLTSPKLNQFGPLFILPNSLTVSPTSGQQMAWWPYRPLTFRNQEEVTALVDNTNAGAQQMDIVVHLSNGIVPIPPGEELFVKFTATTAAVANAWTLEPIVLAQVLPEGVYALVGSELVSASGIAHRWTFWGQFYRPGYPSTQAQSSLQAEPIRWLTLGTAGLFSNVTLPNLEVLCSAADAAYTGFIRVIKVQ